ncbi:MAG: AmmeMemoRadiSam system protein B [Cyclobacteriaceae bacterium]|nr:AmmeMemoRadiSam system protein B [Cyclobacteriaceae bacterium]
MSLRHTAVAGSYYPKEPSGITELLDETVSRESLRINKNIRPNTILGGIVPHAGYVYSAKEAVHFFHFVKFSKEQFDTFIILCPSHLDVGDEISLDSHDQWSTPLGNIDLDLDLMKFMDIPRSEIAHKSEHAAEVILPYLQYFLPYSFSIVPITMRKQTYKSARLLAEKIFKANQVARRKIAVIASSDFSHYVPPEVGFYNDNLVINRILNNNIHELYETIHENNISVCGYGPIMTLMFYSNMIDASYRVEILARGNSAKNSGKDLVVDYVSALFYT